MAKIFRWTRNDLVTNEELTADIPVEDTVNGDYVQIMVPFSAFARVIQWASIGRTLDGAINSCTDDDVVDELVDLKQALCYFQDGCRAVWRKARE